jgi:hypothetical protein
LSNIVQLQVFDSSHNTFITWSVEHDLSTKLGLDRCWITAEDNIARHEANFSSHSQSVCAVIFRASIMLVIECSV